MHWTENFGMGSVNVSVDWTGTAGFVSVCSAVQGNISVQESISSFCRRLGSSWKKLTAKAEKGIFFAARFCC